MTRRPCARPAGRLPMDGRGRVRRRGRRAPVPPRADIRRRVRVRPPPVAGVAGGCRAYEIILGWIQRCRRHAVSNFRKAAATTDDPVARAAYAMSELKNGY